MAASEGIKVVELLQTIEEKQVEGLITKYYIRLFLLLGLVVVVG